MKYLIYDTALNGLPALMDLQERYEVNQSLFKGTKDEALIEVSPWLLQVEDDLDKNLNIVRDISTQFSLLLESASDIHAVSGHLKKFIYQTINGREYFFRFYDSRVLTKFLPTCDSNQIIEMFGPIRYFIAEDAEERVIQFSQENGFLKLEKLLVNT